MVVCKYFLQGCCRFGNRCRFEHTSDGYSAYSDDYRSGGQNRGYHKDYDHQNSGRYDQRYYDDGQSRSHRNGYDHQNRGQRSDRQYYNDDGRSYGNRGQGNQRFYEDDYYYDSRDGYQGGSSRQDGGDYYDDRQHGNRGYQSRYSYRADEHHAPAKTYSTKASALSADQPQTTDDFLIYIKEEMEIWGNSGMWPFSCFAFTRHASSLAGLDDLSVEEVRLNAYEAKANGNLNAYVSLMTELSKDYTAKREQLKSPSGAIKGALIRAIEEVIQAGPPLNTAAGQKASQNVNSEPFAGSFTASVPPSAGFTTPGFGSFGTPADTPSAQTFAGTAATMFPGPANTFSSPSVFGQASSTPQSASGIFAGFDASSQPTPITQPSRVDSSQSRSVCVEANCPTQLYTPLDQLSAEDRAQYEAAKFTLGHVPIRPPPKELV